MQALARLRSLLPVAALAALLAGCGSAQRGLTGGEAAQMRARLAATRAAIAAHDRSGADRELGALLEEVRTFARRGRLSSEQVATLETGIAQARARVPIDVAPAPPPSTVPAVPVPPAPAQGKAGKLPRGENGHGHGRAHGDGGGD